jgi:hypothetical protein
MEPESSLPHSQVQKYKLSSFNNMAVPPLPPSRPQDISATSDVTYFVSSLFVKKIFKYVHFFQINHMNLRLITHYQRELG